MAKAKRFRIIKGERQDDLLRYWPDARPKRSWSRFVPLWAGAIGVGLLAGVGWSQWPIGPATGQPASELTVREHTDRLELQGGLPDAPDGFRGHFSSCHVGGGYNCVVDGDTLYLKGVKIRVADIDAPETHEPKCASEKELGDRATQRLLELVNSGGVALQTIDRDEDAYGRKLRIVLVDGRSVGDTLVGEGLARWYEGGRRPWC